MKKFIILFLLSTALIHAQDGLPFDHKVGLTLSAVNGTAAGGETAFGIGVEYEYFINSSPVNVAPGFFFDASLFDNTELLFGIPVAIYPYEGIKVWMAPSFAYISGWEDTRQYGPDGYLIMEPHEQDFKFFMRYGAGYQFVFQNYAVTPEIYGDVISSKLNVVFGVNFAITF